MNTPVSSSFFVIPIRLFLSKGTGPHYRWYHCRFRYHHPQRITHTDSLRCIPGREFIGYPATGLLQAGKTERSEAAVVQTGTDPRPFPYFHEPDRTGMYSEIYQARPIVSRIKDYRPFLDCNDCAGSNNNNNA